MGLFPTIQEEAKIKGLRLAYKQIPMEVFDKRATSKNEVVFHDVAYIEFKPIIKGKKLSIELTDFSVFYNEDNLNVDEKIPNGKSKLVVENGQIVEKKKDKKGIISEKILTKKWYDWIDYWSVDFDYESKIEVVKTGPDPVLWEDAYERHFKYQLDWYQVYKIESESEDEEEEWVAGSTDTEDDYIYSSEEEEVHIPLEKKRKLDEEWDSKAKVIDSEDYDKWEKKQKV